MAALCVQGVASSDILARQDVFHVLFLRSVLITQSGNRRTSNHQKKKKKKLYNFSLFFEVPAFSIRFYRQFQEYEDSYQLHGRMIATCSIIFFVLVLVGV